MDYKSFRTAINAIKRDLVDEVQIDLAALSPSAAISLSDLESSSSASPSPVKRVVSPLSKKAKLISRDSSPAEVAAVVAAKLRKSPVAMTVAVAAVSPESLSSSSSSPNARTPVPSRKRFQDTRLAEVVVLPDDDYSPPRMGPLPPTPPSLSPGSRPSVRPLPGISKEDPIILAQISHC